MSFRNIFRAWISSVLGALILLIPTVVDLMQKGEVDWSKTGWLMIGAVLLALTDAFKEAKRQLDEEEDEEKTLGV